MYVFLLLLGVISFAAGMSAIGFGIPNYEFGLGNTLIISGSVAMIGGLVLIGLAAAVHQLRRIADGMVSRPVARRPAPDVTEMPVQRAGGPRISYPSKPDAEMPGGEPRASEPRLAAAPAPTTPEETEQERPRPDIFAVTRGANGSVEEPDAVPLAPTRTPAAPAGRSTPATEPAAATKETSSDIRTRLSNLAAPPRPAAKPEPPRPPSSGERHPNMFDSVWPAEVREARARAETIPRAPKSGAAPAVKPESMRDIKAEPKLEPRPRPEPKAEVKPEPRREPAAQQEPRLEVPKPRVEPSMGKPRETASPAINEPRAIAILKSGVIDGMAYTLYTDGSIEAELPQGTMRFSSIDDLRAHLEKTERPE